MDEIFQSSDKAQIKQTDRRWETIEIGQSFAISQSEVKLATLRSKATYNGYKFRKKFRIIIHDSKNCYEIARIK